MTCQHIFFYNTMNAFIRISALCHLKNTFLQLSAFGSRLESLYFTLEKKLRARTLLLWYGR